MENHTIKLSLTPQNIVIVLNRNRFLLFRLVRRSLGDEIKRLGVTGSPFCDKRKSLSPSRIVDSIRCLRDLSEDNNTSNEITPIKKTQLETINENNILECQTDEKNSEEKVAKPLPGSFGQLAKVYLYALSIISIGRSHASHHMKHSLQKVFSKMILISLNAQNISWPNFSIHYHEDVFIEFQNFWIRLFYIIAFVFFLFTFFGAIEVDNKKYYPITWPSKLNSWLDQMNLTKIRIPVWDLRVTLSDA